MSRVKEAIDELIEAVKKLDLSDIDWAEIERERDGDR